MEVCMLLHNKISNSFLSRFTVVCLIIGMLALSSCSVPSATGSVPPSSSLAESSLSSEPASASESSAVSSSVSSSADPVQDVKDYLAGLSRTDMASGKLAIDFIVANTSGTISEADKDILLGLYLEFSYQLLFTLMDQQFSQLNTMRETNQSSFNVLIAQNGLRTLEVDGSFVLVPDFTIILTSMPGILSENGETYCGLMVSTHDLEPIASESGILVPLADLNKLQSEWAAFVTKLTPAVVEFPPSDSTYEGHFEARKRLARLNGLLGIS